MKSKINKLTLGFMLLAIAFILAIISIASLVIFEQWYVAVGYYLICWVLLIAGLIILRDPAATMLKRKFKGG
jgi:hypothetical protein